MPLASATVSPPQGGDTVAGSDEAGLLRPPTASQYIELLVAVNRLASTSPSMGLPAIRVPYSKLENETLGEFVTTMPKRLGEIEARWWLSGLVWRYA